MTDQPSFPPRPDDSGPVDGSDVSGPTQIRPSAGRPAGEDPAPGDPASQSAVPDNPAWGAATGNRVDESAPASEGPAATSESGTAEASGWTSDPWSNPGAGSPAPAWDSASPAWTAASPASAAAAPAGSGATAAAATTGTVPGAGSRTRESYPVRVLKALIDFRFERSAVLESAGILYGLWIAFVLLNWLGALILSMLVGFQRVPSYFSDGHMLAPWLPVVVVLLGWIPALLWIVVGRLSLEFVFAGVRTARETTLIRQHLDGDDERSL